MKREIEMTEDSLLAVRRRNQEIMRRDLYKLKKEYEAEFKIWLEKRGEYLTETYARWAVFRAKAIEYKELHFKYVQNKRMVG